MKIYETAKLVGDENKLKVGENVTIGDYCLINIGQGLEIGDNVYIHAGAKIIGGGSLVLGKNVSIGYNALIATGTDTYQAGRHMVSSILEDFRDVVRGRIYIDKHAWVGPFATVAVSYARHVVRIGMGAVIGAYSYVDRDVGVLEVGYGRPFKMTDYRHQSRDVEW